MTRRTWTSQHQPLFLVEGWFWKNSKANASFLRTRQPYTRQMDKSHHIIENVQNMEENMQQ
jgi:hypothetical protein